MRTSQTTDMLNRVWHAGDGYLQRRVSATSKPLKNGCVRHHEDEAERGMSLVFVLRNGYIASNSTLGSPDSRVQSLGTCGGPVRSFVFNLYHMQKQIVVVQVRSNRRCAFSIQCGISS
jgi:hypothetical protein